MTVLPNEDILNQVSLLIMSQESVNESSASNNEALNEDELDNVSGGGKTLDNPEGSVQIFNKGGTFEGGVNRGTQIFT